MIPEIKFGSAEHIVKSKIVFSDNVESIKNRVKTPIEQTIASKSTEDFNLINTLVEDISIQWIYCQPKNLSGNQYDNLEKIRVYAAGIDLNDEAQVEIEVDDRNMAIAFFEGLFLGNYSFDRISNQPKNKRKTVWVDEQWKKDLTPILAIIEEVAWARDLINKPLSHLTAELLANEVKNRGEANGLEVEVFGKKKLETLKMGGILAVNKGSIDPPTMTVANYKPKNAINTKPFILVGKGVVYDTGGMSLKPTPNSMDMMKSDMGGAACVAATMMAIAKLKLPIHVKLIIPATDNRPGQNAYVPGDVIEMFDGTTVEVLNTDAEGRMLLADALAYAKKFDPELVVDAATLTGAAVRAIGQNAIVAMGNASDDQFRKLEHVGTLVHERIAKMPFWDDYKEELKSDVADLKNIGGPYAGQITAGKFLEHFTNYPYIHLDIAGPTFIPKKKGYLPKGGTGFGVRLLTSFFQKIAEDGK